MLIKGYGCFKTNEFNVEIGDKVRIQYDGYCEVPKYMSGDIVKIVGFTKDKIKVDNGMETFSVRHSQINQIKRVK